MLRRIVIFGLFALLISSCGGTVSNSPSNSAVNKIEKAVEPGPTAQTVSINSPDGAVLVGSFFSSEKPNSPALLLLHQWQSDRHSYDDFAKQMNAKGFAVLSIDGRGFGESTKTLDGSVVTAERTDEAVKAMLGDTRVAFEFLSQEKNVDPNRIGIVGASYGSSLAIIYAAQNWDVRSVALLSPGLNYFGNMATEPAVRKYGDRPLLIVAAEDDPDSANSARRLRDVLNTPECELKLYPSGGHGTGLFRSKVGLEVLLEQYFAGTLEARESHM